MHEESDLVVFLHLHHITRLLRSLADRLYELEIVAAGEESVEIVVMALVAIGDEGRDAALRTHVFRCQAAEKYSVDGITHTNFVCEVALLSKTPNLENLMS